MGTELTQRIKEFYEKTEGWEGKYIDTTELYTHTGYNILKRIRRTDIVLDVGCGVNPFKGKIRNLHGIDIADIGADQIVAIEDFTFHKKFDVALAFGSINYGDDSVIDKQISRIVDVMKESSRIFWRCNRGYRGVDTADPHEKLLYPWTLKKQLYYAEKYGYEITEVAPDTFDRIYVKWERNAEKTIHTYSQEWGNDDSEKS